MLTTTDAELLKAQHILLIVSASQSKHINHCCV